MIYGFQNFNLNIGSIVVSSELIFGPIFALILLNENLTQNEIIGSILVIAAIIVSNISFLKNKSKIDMKPLKTKRKRKQKIKLQQL
jgi:drug/metabolite transporter (DMT)-like permease